MTPGLLSVMLVQWLHVLAGITWMGGNLVGGLLLPLALLQRPAVEGRATFEVFSKAMKRSMPIAGMSVFILGILRGAWLGPIHSWGALFGSPYGHTWLTALILTLGIMVRSGMRYPRFLERLWDGDKVRADAARFVTGGALLDLTGFMLVLACMVLMHFGL
jgi:uncharacterized membrane protein